MEPSGSDTPPIAPENPCKPYWEYKKRKTRENKKQNKDAVKAPKLKEGATPTDTATVTERSQGKLWKKMNISEIQFFAPTIVLDLSYEANMNEKRLRSLASQVQYSYAAVKAHTRPCKLVLSSLIEKSVTAQLLENHDGWATWKLFKESKPVEELYPIESLVYLTPDTEELLESVDESKVYVIGGIVDDNQLKGLSYQKATKLGIKTAKLSIKDLLPSFRNQSLNINHIVEILLDMAKHGDLKSAVERAVPKRYVSPKPVWRPGPPALATESSAPVEDPSSSSTVTLSKEPGETGESS